eukprot:m.167894 g.167894  ORF g.167894 m.167894 type:complete len:145 (-) comp9904_c1_seq38:1428-1862(-)
MSPSSFSLTHYTVIGQHLRTDPAIVALNARILSCMVEPGVIPPFIVLGASSGLGKTQAAFALDPTLRCVYLVDTPPGLPGTQRIYTAFERASSLFMDHVTQEAAAATGDGTSAKQVSTRYFRTDGHMSLAAGVIVALAKFVCSL